LTWEEEKKRARKGITRCPGLTSSFGDSRTGPGGFGGFEPAGERGARGNPERKGEVTGYVLYFRDYIGGLATQRDQNANSLLEAVEIHTDLCVISRVKTFQLRQQIVRVRPRHERLVELSSPR